MADETKLTLKMLKEHCQKTTSPVGKIEFDVNSKIYQEHKMILDLINEHENLHNHDEEIREDERRKFAEWLTMNDYLKFSMSDCMCCRYKDSDCNGNCYDDLLERYEKVEQNDR